MANKDTLISVALLLFNKREGTSVLYYHLKTIFEALNLGHEDILVDEGRSDQTFDVIRDIAEEDPC